MTTYSINPTDQDMSEMKSQLQDAKRKLEYQKLRNELEEITYKSVNTPNEFEGSMQIADTEKVLKTKRKNNHFIDLIITRIGQMLSLRPVTGNIIAVMIAFALLLAIHHFIDLKWLHHYQGYAGIGIAIVAGISVIKSATRSLVLPLIALLVGGTIAHQLTAHETLFYFDRTFYVGMSVVGVIGLAIAVLSID